MQNIKEIKRSQSTKHNKKEGIKSFISDTSAEFVFRLRLERNFRLL